MGDSDSDAEAYSGSMLFTWDELYTASYVASLCVMVVLIAVFADGILEVTNKSSIRGFWMSIGAMTIKLITGCFFKASQSRVHQITVEFIWAVMSSVDRWAICHMVYVRTTAALIQTTMRRKILGEFLVFGVFVFSFLDFGYYAVQTIHHPDTINYSRALAYMNSIYFMLLDLGLYFLLARKLKRQDRILYPNRQDSSFSRAFKGTQLLRIFLFFLIEVMCCYLAVRSRFGVVVQMTFTVVCVTRPFIVLTDMRRVQLIQDASSHRSTTKAADASKRILVERTQDLEESKALAPPSNALLPPADIEIANKMPPERQDEACK